MRNRISILFLVCAVALLLPDCGEIKEVAVNPLDATLVRYSTRIYLESNPSEQDCEAMQSDFSWGAPLAPAGSNTGPITVADEVSNFEPLFDDSEGEQTVSGGCIYKGSMNLDLGNYEFRARQADPGDNSTLWDTTCVQELFMFGGEVFQIFDVDFTVNASGCDVWETGISAID